MRNHNDIPEISKPRPGVLSGIPVEGYKSAIGLSGPGRLSHKIQRNLEDYGWKILLQKSLTYLVRWVYFRQAYRIYRIDLGTAPSPQISNTHNFTFKLLTVLNVDMIAQVENIAEWLRGQLKEKIAAGQLCLVALDADEVVGFNLIHFQQATLLLVNLTRSLRPGNAWSEHIAVKKEFRKTGLGSQLRHRIFEELRNRNIRKLYGGTLLSNTASLKLTKSVGFRMVANIHYRKLFSLERWRYVRVRG